MQELKTEMEKLDKLAHTEQLGKNYKYAKHIEQKVNAGQPSEEFINELYKDREKHFKKAREIENSFSANPMYFTGFLLRSAQ